MIVFLLYFILIFNNKYVIAQFSEHQFGIIDKIELKTDKKILFLTLDACNGKFSTPDMKLIEFLDRNNIKTTLFINSEFLRKNKKLIKKLSESNNFSIQNHGTRHIPASIDGKSVYGIKGTENREKLIEEVQYCDKAITDLIGVKPKWYRSGTAYYDTESIEIIKDLGYNIAGFTITIDEGATLTAKKVKEKMLKSKNGYILLAHMNHPESGTREGIIQAIKILKELGFYFELLP